MINVEAAGLDDVLIMEPEVFFDERGSVFESFNLKDFEDCTGLSIRFVQDLHTHSKRGVLRGLHYQAERPQAKLIRVTVGEIFDVAVDLRPHSRHYGKWVGAYLSADSRRQLWIPEGFAHGYLVTSDVAEVLYKTTEYRWPHDERVIAWDDRHLQIDWPLQCAPVLSPRDAAAAHFAW